MGSNGECVSSSLLCAHDWADSTKKKMTDLNLCIESVCCECTNKNKSCIGIIPLFDEFNGTSVLKHINATFENILLKHV